MIEPELLSPLKYTQMAENPSDASIQKALATSTPGPEELIVLLSDKAGLRLEELAGRAMQLTKQHFGHNIALYVPLYISNFCTNGCAYCGFASDRHYKRQRMELNEIRQELTVIKQMGFEEILLLTGERDPRADFDYLHAAVKLAAEMFHLVTIEAFPMTTEEYRKLALTGCQGVTIYQETYDRETYSQVHRWGPKRDYQKRFHTPEFILEAGMRNIGLGVLLGLTDPRKEAVTLFLHIRELQKKFWRAGFSVSFPRLRPEAGKFKPPHLISDRFLMQLICAFRICLPDVSLNLSTRESAAFRDGIAGIGINKMSIASRTTVGGYNDNNHEDSNPQFLINDQRGIDEFFCMLQKKGLEPVFKNWDRVFDIPQPPIGL